jgi:uncharacterized protein involved in cysteine biosynthesis
MHGPDPITAVVMIAGFALICVGAGLVAFLALDLVCGAIVLAIVRRKRHLWWTLPPINVAAWFFAVPRLLQSYEMRPWEYLNYVGVPGVLLCAVLAIGILAPLQILICELRKAWAARRAAAPGTLPPQKPLPEYFNRPVAATAARSFWEGITTAWDGFLYLCQYPRLWKFGVVPILMNIVITIAVLVGLVMTAVGAIAYLHPQYPDGWGWLLLEVIVGIALGALALLGAVIAWVLLEGILCGYYYGKLAEEIELQLGTPEDEIHPIPLKYQVLDAFGDVGWLLLVNLGLLLLNIVPVIGSILAFCGSLYITCSSLGKDYFDFPLALRGKRRQEKRAYFKARRWHTLGLGLAVILLHLVPIVGSIFLTTAAAGSVLLYRRMERTP